LTIHPLGHITDVLRIALEDSLEVKSSEAA
jgi:hypothetical protein